MPIRKRSQARMLALQALCAYDALDDRFNEQLDAFLADAWVHEDLGLDTPVDEEIIRFARSLAQDTWRRRGALDERVARAAAHWSIERMTPVDRNVLRLGLCELLTDQDMPPQVVLNEAIELARRFGDTDSPGFVNGVLDALRREIVGSGDPHSESASRDTRPAADDSQTEQPKGDDGTV